VSSSGVTSDSGVCAAARPRSTAFGEDAYPSLHDKAAALLHSIARNHPLVDGRFIHCFELAETILLRVTLELCRRSTRGLAPSSLVASQIARRLGRQAHAPVIEISNWCDTEAQPGLIAVGVNDSVQVAAPSWLTSVRRRLHSLFSPPVTDTFVDFPRALPA
jgi:hypothetical protein